MTVFAGICAATSVALGAVYMFAAGAPRHYIFVNAAALAIGVIAASLIRRVSIRDQRSSEALTVAIGLLLVVTAWYGVHIDGASRWIGVGGISLQPSLILLPPTLVHFARHRGWGASVGLVIAAIGVGMQPDRAMAGTLAIGLSALWLYRRELPVTVALVAATAAFAATLQFADAVAPVRFVEQVVQSAFAFHMLTGLAIVAGLLTMLAPAAGAFTLRTRNGEVLAVFGATWLAIAAFSIVGNYPTPLVGYGSSAILGYCLSAAMLSPRGKSAMASAL